MMRMLDFRPTSIVGYNAVLCLPSVLRGTDWPVTAAFIMEVIERRSPSAIFFGNLLMCNLSYTDPAFARPSLDLIHDRIVPLVLRERLWMDWSTIFCVATLDTPSLWERLEAVLRMLFDELEKHGDAAAIAAFSGAFFKLSYCRDLELGKRTIEMLCREPDRFLGPVWRATTLTLFAAMLTRHPATLRASLAAAGMEESILHEARAYQTEEVVYLSRMFPFQVDVNRCTAWQFGFEPRMRRAYIKYGVGSLACGSEIGDFVVGVRHSLIAAVGFNFGSDPDGVPEGRLSVEEIAEWVAATCPGGRAGEATPEPAGGSS
jgi:hypothetical protein